MGKPNLKLPFAAGTPVVIRSYKGSPASDAQHGVDHYWALDLEASSPSSTVVAAASGQVAALIDMVECPRGVAMSLGGGYSALYCGMSSRAEGLTEGMLVAQGDTIGKLEGPAPRILHFELLYGQCASAAVTRASPQPISGYADLAPGMGMTSDNFGASGSTARLWTFAENAEGWFHEAGRDYGVNEGLSMDPGPFASWTSPVLSHVAAEDWKAVSVKASCTSKNPQQATLWFSTQVQPEFSSDRALSLPVDCDGSLKELIFDFDTHPLWSGNITRLRIAPVSDAEVDFAIDDRVSLGGVEFRPCALDSCAPAVCSCLDGDGDGYYSTTCNDPACVPCTDCEDALNDVHPGVQDTCGNGVDEDCSGQDSSCGCGCIDGDLDGYLPSECTDPACPQGTDCEDADPTIHPGASETCGNTVDEDCSGIDEPCTCGCVDSDDDGYYPTTCADLLCAPSTDCDDATGYVHPGASDICNDGIDQDCTGADAVCACSCVDADFDGFYSTVCKAAQCSPNGDCDDSRPQVHPGATDVCENGLDEDCVGGDLVCSCTCLDADGDGYFPYSCVDPACSPSGDCDDKNANRHPGHAEVCGNAVDEDCNGSDLVCACSCVDADGDGYYSVSCSDADCLPKGDCNDLSESSHPGGTETCGNGLDDDCVGGDQACPCSCKDADADGYYPTNCTDPNCAPRTDCDDGSTAAHPGGKEVCGNSIDEDCDGASPACPGATEWTRRFGDGAYQSPENVAVDSTGNIVVGGNFQGAIDFGGGPLTCAGGVDIFLAKFSPSGQHLWSRRYGDAGYEQRFSTALDGAGNIYVTGIFTQTINLGGGTLASTGGNDIFLGKMDGSGNLVWSKSFGNSDDQRVHAIAVDAAGNVAITGMYKGSVNFGGPTHTNPGTSWDYYVALFNASGTHLFSRSAGDGSEQRGAALAFNSAGNLICGGDFGGTVDFGAGPLSATDIDSFVVAYQASGGVLYSKRFGGTGDQRTADIGVDATGNVFMGGTMAGTMTFGATVLTADGMLNAYVARLDAGGNAVWAKRFGAGGMQAVAGLALDGAGAVSVTGNMSGSMDFGGGVLTSAGDNDAFFAKLDGNGNHVWSRRGGDALAQGGLAISAMPGGAVVATGYLTGTMDLGAGMMTSAGGYDVFLARFAP